MVISNHPPTLCENRAREKENAAIHKTVRYENQDVTVPSTVMRGS